MRVFHAPPADSGLRSKQRAVAAVWFAVFALVPILFLGGTLGGSTTSLKGFMLFILPVVTAGFFGFSLGFRILDLSATRSNGAAALNGMYVGGLSLISYLAILAFIVVSSTPDKLTTGWIVTFLVFLFYGAIFIGWFALIVGAGGGLLLYRLSLVAGSGLRFSNIPNAIMPKDVAISAAIVFGVVSPIFIPRVVFPVVYRILESESAKAERLKKQIVHAAQMGNGDEIGSLLAEGADPNSRQELTGQTPLALVVSNSHKDAARVLLEYGADPNATGPDDWTPLIWATGHVDREIMMMLVEFGADVNLPAAGRGASDTPLIKAAVVNDIEAAKYLLGHGAKINLRNRGGKTALGVVLDQKRMQLAMAAEQGRGHEPTQPAETTGSDDFIRSRDKMIEFLRQNGATE
jgi:uncharacterized protein